MAREKFMKMDGHFIESDYENALISYLEKEGWQYLFGDTIPRNDRKEVLYMDDLLQFLVNNNKKRSDRELSRSLRFQANITR